MLLRLGLPDALLARVDRPPGTHRRAPVLPGETMPGGKLLDAAEPGARCAGVVPGVMHHLRVRLGLDQAGPEERFDFAREQERRFRLGPIEGLDAEAVPRR